MDTPATQDEVVGTWLSISHRFYISYVSQKDEWHIFRVTVKHILTMFGIRPSRQARTSCGDFYVKDNELKDMTDKQFVRHIMHLSDKASYQEYGLR
ncbi:MULTISPECIES: hypothetical protein [Komagataeibacter]|uniref:Uncharacterized protein n=2 Tax=Komagataeibacter TaxID=1434011 RepID=A0A318QYA3_9PROT|nr:MULTISPECIES: hypothetical protein [Komagataeibacter]GBR35349.1 hypothetical protein AA11826_1387 [Komagataeibacter oboediens DSM 11826]MBL7232012.1 hypothetical protein [Komagataeibacter oboediens]MBT0675356.1 hypothetical protein [Komagataeibacter oboediens]MBT0678951.1 hypothetical protein [Komagataeibacter oboediens]MBV0887535.1 hypothetical protein [Komagataeibacter oboediens]